MIIDAHTHGFHDAYFDKMEAMGNEWINRAVKQLRKNAIQRPQYSNIAARLDYLKKYNIDLQVVSMPLFDSSRCPGDAPTQLTAARAVNDVMAKIRDDSKGKLITIGTVPINAIEQGGRQELERAVNTLGLKGVNVSTTINGKPLDLPEYEPFWALAAEMNIPVYTHPYRPVGCDMHKYEADYDIPHNFGFLYETTLMITRLVFSGIIERYPSLKIVVHHLGGMIPFFWGRITETYEPEKQMERAGREMPEPLFQYFSRFYFDTAVGGSAPAIKLACELFGAERLLFATDYPNGPKGGEVRLANYADIIRSLGFSSKDTRNILEDNARELLNL